MTEASDAVVHVDQPPPNDWLWYQFVNMEGAHLVRCHPSKRPVGRWKERGLFLDEVTEACAHGALIGVVPASLNCVVLDIDVPKQDGQPTQAEAERRSTAEARMKAALRALGDPTPVAVYPTPSGGLHVWLRCTEPAGNRQWALPDDPLIPAGDIRGSAGFVIPWGDGFREILGGDFQGATPVRSLDALPKPLDARIRKQVSAAVEEITAAPEGARNDTLNKATFALAQRGYATPSAMEALRSAALQAGLARRETEATIASAIEAGKAVASRSHAEDMREAAFQRVLPGYRRDHIMLPARYGSPSGLWRSEGALWHPVDLTVIEAEVRSELDQYLPRVTAPAVREAVARIRQMTVPNGARALPAPDVGVPWRLSTGEVVEGTVFRNALVGVTRQGKVRVSPLESDIFLPVQPLPIDWAEEAGPTPLLDRFLEETLEGSGVTREWMLAQIGRALCPRLLPTDGPALPSAHAAQKTAVVLVGPERTGKGTLLRIVAGLTGSRNVADTVDSFGGRFGTAKLLHQRVVLIRDMEPLSARRRTSSDVSSSVAVLKSLIDQEPVEVELKGVNERPHLDWRGSVWIASNHDAPFAQGLGDLGSWADRIAHVACSNTRPAGAREDGLAERIIEQEAPSVARRCVEAYAQMVRGEIEAVPAVVRTSREDMLAEHLPPEVQFVHEVFAKDPKGGPISASRIRHLREEWADANDTTLVARRVNRALHDLGGASEHVEKGTVWSGLRVVVD